MYTTSVLGRVPDLVFEWDSGNVAHLALHEIQPAEVEEVFRNNPSVKGHDVVQSEDRWTAVGATLSLRVLVVVFIIRNENVRAITGWDASKRTREEYFQERGV